MTAPQAIGQSRKSILVVLQGIIVALERGSPERPKPKEGSLGASGSAVEPV